MQIQLKDVNSYTRELSIRVPWEELEPDFEKSVKKFAKKIRLHGFRPGKIPRKVLFKNYLPNLEDEFIEDALNKAYFKALGEKEIVPVNKADITDLDFHYECDLSFKAKVEFEPEIKLPTLKKNSLAVQKTTYVTDDEELQLAIDEMRSNHMNVQTIESGAREGSFLVCDLQELDGSGAPLIGKKLENRYIKLGEGIFTGDRLEQLIGITAGEDARITVPHESREIAYRLTVNRVEEHTLPDVDEDFLKIVDPEAESVAAWKDTLKKSLDAEYARRANEAFDRHLSDALIGLVDIHYPPSMVAAYLDHMLEDFRKSNPNEKLADNEVRRNYRPLAERNLKWYLLRKAIIRQASLEVTKEEVQAEVDRLVDRSPQYAEELKKYYRKPSNRTRIEDDLMEKKILEYLGTFAKIKDVKVKTSDLRKQAPQEG